MIEKISKILDKHIQIVAGVLFFLVFVCFRLILFLLSK